ncbi:MAG: hypothetical protein MUE85_03840 [Microscillaceae bacterium]|nr:hypothetical protein [Microscillaceae bacterium]
MICLIFLVLTACSSINIRQLLAGTDTIEIIFYQPNRKIVADTIRLQEKAYIRELINSIGLTEQPTFKCGYQGKLRFLKARVRHTILEAEFNLQKDCAHLSFLHNQALHTRKIDQSGVEFLQMSRKYKEVIEGLELAQKQKLMPQDKINH